MFIQGLIYFIIVSALWYLLSSHGLVGPENEEKHNKAGRIRSSITFGVIATAVFLLLHNLL